MKEINSSKKKYRIVNSQTGILIPGTILPKKSSDMTCLSLYFTSDDGNIELLEKTYNIILRDNDALRVKLIKTIKGLRQYFDDYEYQKVEISEIDSEDILEKEMNKYRHFDDFYNGENLANAHIFVYNHKATILINVHHIIIDGYGFGLIISDFVRIYSQLQSGTYKQDTIDNKYTFEEYISNNQFFNKTKKFKKDKKYYRDKFNKTKKLKIISPILRPSSPVKYDNLTICGEDYQNIIDYSKKVGVPVSYFITSMIAKALCRVKKQSDICFFQLNNGRPKANQKRTYGNMIGYVITFFHHDDKQSYDDYVKENYIDYLESNKHGTLTALQIIQCALRHSLKILRFNYFAITVSCLNFDNNIKYDNDLTYGSVRYKYQPTPFYCTVQNNDKDAHIILSYQSVLISQEKLNVIKEELMSCIRECTK